MVLKHALMPSRRMKQKVLDIVTLFYVCAFLPAGVGFAFMPQDLFVQSWPIWVIVFALSFPLSLIVYLRCKKETHAS